MGLAHWSSTAHPVKQARGCLAQRPPGKIPNACLAASDAAAASGLAPPMVSLPYHLRRPRPHLICCCMSKPIPSPPLHAPHRSLCSSMATRAATTCRAALPSALQDHIGSPSATLTPSHRPASSHRSASKLKPPATSSTATSSMTSSSSHHPGPPRRR
jgi:hypothetical protein